MLLPSDVARLVLGYLQEEGLSATSQAFIHESPNLKEYADHTSGDGAVPACVFSIFGNGLTTILNEYVATKAKESHHEVPAVMTSLWKKLDFTLNQIKSLQNSPVISACQRTRSRIGVANMARQRVLAVASPGTIVCSSVPESSSIISPAHASHGLLSHSTPLSPAAPLTPASVAPTTQQQQQVPDVRLNEARDSLAQTCVSEQRFTSGPMSPARRKWDTPRKRAAAAAASVPSAANRSAASLSGSSGDPQLEEVVDENFPQLVIQNAREKMLGDRSLQEKLAENINKILAGDPLPQMSKSSTTALETDQSIDEILGLEGEIHMSDDAIHDILEQTESDPAFQALYDLFDYNKTKVSDAEAAEGASQGFAGDGATPAAAVRPLPGDDPGSANTGADALDAALSAVKKAGQERKLRKTSTLLKKTFLRPSGRSSRIENSSARLLVSHGEALGSAAERGRKARHVPSTHGQPAPPTDANGPPNPPPPPADSAEVLESVPEHGSATPSALLAAALAEPEQRPEKGPAPAVEGQPGTVAAASPLLPVARELHSFPAANLPQRATAGLEGRAHALPAPSCSPSQQAASPVATGPLFTAASASVALVSASSSPGLASSSFPAAPGCPTVEAAPAQLAASKPAADPSVLSLKIIISDDKEDSCGDAALNQAVSSISGDKIPTIYISSSPGVPGPARVSSDEVAQAVSGLQRSEAPASPPSSRAGPVVAGTPALQQNYIIQLEAAAPAAQGAPAGYFLLAEPPNGDAQPRQVLLSKAPLPFGHYGVPAQASSPSYPTGSPLLPSPAKPVMLPVSVMGQKALGPVQLVSSQLLTVPVQQPGGGTPTSPTASLTSSAPDPEQRDASAQPLAPENQGQQEGPSGPKHKRILCFDSSGETQPRAATTSPSAPNTRSSAAAPRPQRDAEPAARTRPNILGGNRAKRRLQPGRGLKDPQAEEENLEQSARDGADGAGSSRQQSGRQPGSDGRSTSAEDGHASGTDSASGWNKDEATGKLAPKPREGRTEKKAPSQEGPSVTGNKENEMKEQPGPSSSLSQAVTASPPKTPKTPSKTSSLAKQAAQMLHNLQGHKAPSESPGPHQEDHGNAPRTPGLQKKAKDGDGTPKQLLPPSTPEVPSCSPVSEAGSENSIKMAAHTLMILSRATIARTGTPLKDSLRQDGVEDKIPSSSKNSKKRKLPSPADTPPAKKDRERKKLMDCFPRNLDVDKFLSSLHYDE